MREKQFSQSHWLILRSYKSAISLLLIFCLLHLSVSCNYYQLNQVNASNAELQHLNEAINAQKYFVVVSGDETLYASQLLLSADSLTMQIKALPEAYMKIHSNVHKESKRYNTNKGGKGILNEVRIVLAEGQPLQTGSITIPFSAIQRIDIVEPDSGKTVASHVFGGIGIALGALVVLAVIVALTKSSCPFVYTHNGEGYSLAGETFGGAIFSPIERDDYLPLPGFSPTGGYYQLKIQNELKERQYINQARLLVAEHPAHTRALMDRRGGIHTISNPQAPLSALANGIDYSQAMRAADQNMYLFNEAKENSANTELLLNFAKEPEAQQAKLVLSLKNSLWLDYLWGEFTQLFGSAYASWAEKQKSVPKQELEQWFFDQQLPLRISIKEGSHWKAIDHVELIGPLAAARQVVIPISDLSKVAGDQLQIKLESGFMFWELDYAALDYSANEVLNTHSLESNLAITHTGTEVGKLLAAKDQRYLEQLRPGEFVELRYTAPTAQAGAVLSPFLHSRGYYEHIREYDGIPNMLELYAFKKPGKFTNFSKEKYQEYTKGLGPQKATQPLAYAN